MSLVGFKARNHPQQTPKPSVDDRATPSELFDPLNARFRFTIDVAASGRNTKCQRWFSVESNGLLQSWAGERVWCNPPYSDIATWVIKAWYEHERTDLIVMLLPANRTEQGWWQRYVEPYRLNGQVRVEFIARRQRFIAHDAIEVGKNERPPFGVCLLIWTHDA